MRWVFALGLCLCSFLAAPAKADSYVVLPFFNLSKEHNLDWIGESLSETILDALSSESLMPHNRDDRLEAYSRLGIRPYTLLTKASVVKLGETLDAERVIYGQFEVDPARDAKTRGTLRILARILDLKRMRQGPEFRELGALEDLAALANHLAWQTLRFVKPDAAPSEAAFRRQHPAVRVDAVENYVRGLLASNAAEKHRLFTQAVRLDAGYTPPCFQLGRLHWSAKEYKAAGDWFQKVAATDPHYREATFFLGLCRYYTGDFAAAQNAFQTVAGLVPLNEIYNNLGAAESRRNLPEALDAFRKALEGDSGDPAYQFNVGYALWKGGDFTGAAERFRAVLARDPADSGAATMLARCLKRSGFRNTDTRVEGLERLKTNYEESAYWQLKALVQSPKL